MKKLAIVTTHPIQYHSPIFQLLSLRKKLEIKVFYTKQQQQIAYDKGFGKEVVWDIPLLSGYNYQFQPGGYKQNKALIEAIKSWNPDTVLVFGWAFPGHLHVLRHFKGKIPIWFRGDSTLLNEKPGLKAIIRRIFLTWVYKKIDCALYVGTNNRKYFEAHGVPDSKLLFVPHAIDNIRFSDSQEKKYEELAYKWRTDLGLEKDDFVIIYAGKLEYVKNLMILIQSVKRINNQKNKKTVKLILAGSGSLENKLRKAINLDPHFHLIGFQNQSAMPIVYRLGDVFCLPSRSETWGLSVNEALASGRPVIVSNKVGCGTDLVQGKKFGEMFIYSSTTDLVDAIKKVISYCKDTDKQEIQKIVSNSIKDWSFESICEGIEKKIQEGVEQMHKSK